MSDKYVIRWKSKVNGRAGRGTKEFSREQADLLARELNSEYPDIEHEPVPAPLPQPQAAEEQAASQSEPEPKDIQEQPSHNHVPAVH